MKSNLRMFTSILLLGAVSCSLYAEEKTKPVNMAEYVNFNSSTLNIRCQDIAVGISEWKMWTLNGIEFRGTQLATTDSAYGSVFGIPGAGWIGSAHKDVEIEALRNITMYLDGKELNSWPAKMEGKTFKLMKSSRIRDLSLKSIVEIHDNLIEETTEISTQKDVPLNLAVVIMYAWTPDATGLLAHSRSGEELQDTFNDNGRKEYALKNVEWAGVYDPNSGKGAVSYLVTAPEAGGCDLGIVSAPDIYRKYYLRAFAGQTVPAGFKGKYKLVTGFFEANPDTWQDIVRKTASDLQKTAAQK